MAGARDELLIIGAGPAGLSLAYHYPGSKRILERSDEPGGLCRSIEFGGGVFDLGGHSFHTPHAEVGEFVERLMHGNWGVQKRDAKIWFDGEIIPYPFQSNFGKLRDRAIAGECAAPPEPRTTPPANFEDWILARFGEGVARHFMLPYNRKLWARDLKRMSCDWVGERVASSGKEEADKRKPLHSGSMVGYPAEGGFGAIFETMASGCGPIEYGCGIVRIDPARRVAESGDGRGWPWGQLASTMPLPLLLRSVEGTPPELQEKADELESVALRVMMILVADPLPGAPQRVYVSDPAVPPHKIAFNHTSSPALRQRPVHAIMCEISHSSEKPLPPDCELERATLDWLRAAGLVPRHAGVAGIRHVDVAYGYPVYTPARAAIVAESKCWLREHRIETLGRFGAWDYANSDECIRQGMAAARRLAAF